MAFRRVRRRYIDARKNSNIKSIVEELLGAIEGNGMTIRTWFEIMDQLSNNNMINQSEFSKGMEMLQNHSTERMKQPVLSAEQIQELFVYMDANHDGILVLNEVALACKVEHYKTTSSQEMDAITSMMQALDDYMGVHYMKIRDLFVHLDRDKSDGLSRAEIRCGFHAIQAEAKRKQEAAVRRKQKEAVKRAIREDEARIAEAKREEMDRLVYKQRRLSMAGEAAWILAPLTSQHDPWVTEENGLLYKAARGRAPAQALIVYFRSYKPDDGPVYGVIMHPREFLGNVTMRVTLLFKYNDDKYAGPARILHPTGGAFEAANASSAAFVSKPELRYIETDSEWRDVIGRQFASKSEARLHHISKWIRDQLATLSAAEEKEPRVSASAVKESLGEVMEFVNNPDNLWAVTREMLETIVSYIRAPQSESDEAPVLAATILWKLSEYEDFVLPLLRADAAGKCAAAIEELGPPRAGPLQYWLQVSVQTRVTGVLCRIGCAASVDGPVRLRVASALIAVVARPRGPLEARKDYREGADGKILSFASFALGNLVATSTSIRGSIAHRSSLFDALVSALRPATGGAGGARGGRSVGGVLGGSPLQAVACAAFCLAHVTTGESAPLLTRGKILSACLTLSGLLDVCVDQLEAGVGDSSSARGATDGSASEVFPITVPNDDAAGAAAATGESGTLSVTMVMESAGKALWGCLSHLSDSTNGDDSTSRSIRDSSSCEGSVGSPDRTELSSGGISGGASVDSGCQAPDLKGNEQGALSAAGIPSGNAEGGVSICGGDDSITDRPSMSPRHILSKCALTLLGLLSQVAKHHAHRRSSVGVESTGNDPNCKRMSRSGRTGSTSSTKVSSNIDHSETTGKSNSNGGNSSIGGVPHSIVAIAGSCLSRVAQDIDLAAGPPGAMESVLALLLPSAGLLVRQQAALTLSAIAGQGFQTLSDFRTEKAAVAAAARWSCGGGGNDSERNGGSDDAAQWPGQGEGGRERKRLLLWGTFCAGVVEGTGAQIILDCALPGPSSRPNSRLLRERAALAFSLVCLCAGLRPASSAVQGGIVSLLRCRDGEVVGGAATAALWALCRVPVNRKAFAKTRCFDYLLLTSITRSRALVCCTLSENEGVVTSFCSKRLQKRQIYPISLLVEPENALQITNHGGSIAKLVSWATPLNGDHNSEDLSRMITVEDNAKTASCLGVIRRCLLLPEGMKALADGLASYSLIQLVLQLLRVGVWVKSVLPLTLREAQGVLFAVQDRAEYRGYCESICGGDPFGVEDTLALQLQRPGVKYAALAGDAVVGLASLSVTLASRRRLAVNGTVESVDRLLARSMAIESGGGREKGSKGDHEAVRNMAKLLKNLSSVPEAHRRLSNRPLLPLITRLWEESPDEATSQLACHVLANLSRSDVPGVRNRLFQLHLAAESEVVRRTRASGGAGTTPAPIAKQKPSAAVPRQGFAASSTATRAQHGETNSRDDDTVSLSSSVFRRDGFVEGHRYKGNGCTSDAKSAAVLLSQEALRRDARRDAQYRLRLMPAALWGSRARHVDDGCSGGEDGLDVAGIVEKQRTRQTFLTAGLDEASGAVAVESATVTSTLNARHDRHQAKRDGSCPSKQKIGGAAAVVVQPSVGDFDDGGGDGIVFQGTAKVSQAASLKRPAVTANVPLRWQSRVVALSSLRDSLNGGATRGSPSMGQRMAKARCRARQRSKENRQHEFTSTTACKDMNKGNNSNETQESKEVTSSDSASPDQRCRPSKIGDTRMTLAEWTSREDVHVPGGEKSTDDSGGCGRGAEGILSLVEGGRPSTAPMHSDGKVIMRPLGLGQVDNGVPGGSLEPPSVVFEPGSSRLRTRRIILDRVYRFTRHQEQSTIMGAPSGSTDTNRGTTEFNKGSAPDPAPQAGLTSSGSPEDPGKAGGHFSKETIILEPTSPTTHFVFKPPPRNCVDSEGRVVLEASSEGVRIKDDDRIRLDRFQHVPGCMVCRGSLGHVKGMDGRYYHHYASSDRMWYMPEHPGPYPTPAEPPSLEKLGILPPEPEPPLSPVSGEVVLPSPEDLPGTEPPNAPPLSRHYMKVSTEACSRCQQGGKCPGQGLCPVMGVVPVESVILLVEEPRLRDDFDDLGEAVVAEDGRAWSVERSSVFSQRKRQCESRAVLNTDKVKRSRFEMSFGRASKMQRFPRFVAEGNRDIIIKKTSVKQEIAVIRETLWAHYNTLLSSFNYYVSLDGVFGEPDGAAFQLGRDQYSAFLSDILHTREKENKVVNDELNRTFAKVNAEEDSSTASGLANLDRRLCEQEWMECMVRIAAILYRKETNNGSVARALSRFMAELVHRLPKAALLDPDAYRREWLYKEGLEKALTKRIEGFRALFQTYPKNNLAVKAARRRIQVPKEELLRFSLTDWEMLVDDAGIFRMLQRAKVKRVFIQSRMLVTDELVDRTKNCCLTPVDFLEAMVRLADALPRQGDLWPTTEESFEEFCSVLFSGLETRWAGRLRVHMAGSDDDGRTVLNFRNFMKNTGIETREATEDFAASCAIEDDRKSVHSLGADMEECAISEQRSAR
ncbi:conserved unknown protein [Ectocarpus siliculosus]|uniref:Uncharacterized protein n=1 Tax=Ectocarpus siliculosus TaxID=2880 RepID=D8LET6_ECTSI|nr:conserved unknown protein [Ectocarpus siliculosus]|eukprot:CBN79756.1 conserved unknown protein [Ectocarpus siliculosus]